MPASRTELAARFRADRDAWRALVAEVGPERMGERGPMGDWSFHDLVGHLSSWRMRTVGRLEAAARGEPRPANPWPASMSEDDPINEWFRERDAARPTEELLGEYDASFERLAAAIEALPPDLAFEPGDEPGYFRWRDGSGDLQSDFFNHFEEHVADVRRWLSGG